MNLICDLIFAGIILFSLWLGYKKGFIKTLFGFLESFVSLILTLILVNPVSSFISNKIFMPILTGVINNKLSSINDFSDISSVSQNSNIIKFFSRFDSVKEGIKSLVSDVLLNGDYDIDAIRLRISEIIAEPLSRLAATAVSLIILFIIIRVALKIVEVVLDIISKLPLIKGSNKFLGIVFGLLRGILIAFVFTRVVTIAEPLLQNSDKALFSEFNVEKTVLIKSADKINPLNEFISISEDNDEIQ